MTRRVTLFGRTALVGLVALGLSGCSWLNSIGAEDEPQTAQQMMVTRQNTSDVAGMTAAAVPAAGAAVNAFLWRAALDTVAFMPVTQADPYGGVILTDWFSPPATPSERFKINLYILDAALRADGIRATVFRQVNQNGFWTDAPVAPETVTQMEDTILTRARQLRQANAPAR
ncbi:DUF3576 domain-containing protein [Aerophototrophica crusticola]|uniref:DUF3576 domain-containing protein n=1 Tax=Aerophototrophica crusticola TaxID=1709002 RepID=A0A858RAC6_9PROT|nr:DUF3576 domain-containing protein [Rhodospirillaceae bacterium B3]